MNTKRLTGGIVGRERRAGTDDDDKIELLNM